MAVTVSNTTTYVHMCIFDSPARKDSTAPLPSMHSGTARSSPLRRKCYHYGNVGHIRRNCPLCNCESVVGPVVAPLRPVGSLGFRFECADIRHQRWRCNSTERTSWYWLIRIDVRRRYRPEKFWATGRKILYGMKKCTVTFDKQHKRN